MKKSLQIVFLLFFGSIAAQSNTSRSVYFGVDNYKLDKKELSPIIEIINSPHIQLFEAIQLYGYCDDRGSIVYNDNLSKKRVEFVQKLLISKGVSQSKIFICEGRGKVVLDKDTVKNLKQVRDKNRRVDLIFLKKTTTNNSISDNPKVGDIINLSRVRFDMGSSELTLLAKNELDRITILLKNHKTMRFEIKGHVCCTSSKYKDAIDKENHVRNLSENRAKNVFLYFRSKGISPYRMSYKGYGNQFPLGKEDSQDRRVELYIIKL